MTDPQRQDAESVATWEWSDDPSDPCSACLSWTDYDMENEGTPWLVSGQVAPRVWRGIHKECQRALAQYDGSSASNRPSSASEDK